MFLSATRQLRRDQPTYEKHDKALAAAGKKEWKTAIALTHQAIKLQPREARFYITKGRLHNRAKRYESSLSAYSRALTLDNNFFAPHLYRGLLYTKSNNYTRAEADLSASFQRLKTQPAAFHLGEIAQRNNQRDNAISYYRQAAQGGNFAKEASGRLQRLGIR